MRWRRPGRRCRRPLVPSPASGNSAGSRHLLCRHRGVTGRFPGSLPRVPMPPAREPICSPGCAPNPGRNPTDPGAASRSAAPRTSALPSPVTSLGAARWLTPSPVDPAPRGRGSFASPDSQQSMDRDRPSEQRRASTARRHRRAPERDCRRRRARRKRWTLSAVVDRTAANSEAADVAAGQAGQWRARLRSASMATLSAPVLEWSPEGMPDPASPACESEGDPAARRTCPSPRSEGPSPPLRSLPR